ncbi:MAG TPA: siderophore-interacting protein [Jatrophihabitans sp.]|nr:siderophore-interacting protein [Jatrophihabitans sp.]
MPSSSHLTRTGRFQAEVTALSMLSPRMRRITLAAPELAGVAWPLACDVAVALAGPDGREVRRRYTVRAAAGDSIVLDAVLHGHGPGSSWAAGLQLGDQVGFVGPRGEIAPADADWLLALTDEAGLPAIAALAEALGGHPVTVLAELADEGERYPLPANADPHWLSRDGQPAGSAELLLGALATWQPPAGRGYAYALGESRAVVRWRDELARLGLGRESVYAKGYWNLNARPTR